MINGRIQQYIIIVSALFLGLISYSLFIRGEGAGHSFGQREILLGEERARHILYGDEYGGGHKYGVGNLCKTEFPAEWNDQHILSTIRDIAANDNLTWEHADNGYYVAEDIRGDVRVRVVLGPKRQEVITGYPVNLPRNPCPAPVGEP